MGKETGIEWTDATWNPIIGCSRVSEGCRNCYAETIAGRFGGGKPTVYSGLTQIVNGRSVWTGEIKETKQILQPLAWKKPKRIFVNSMSDLFHENVSDELRDKIFAVMALCPQHVFQVLTKRPKRMLEYCRHPHRDERTLQFARLYGKSESQIALAQNWIRGWPLPNVWSGVSVENQAAADERVPLLLQTPAAVRFISAEPLLGPVDLSAYYLSDRCGGKYPFPTLEEEHRTKRVDLLDWVICGGESGPNARPMDAEWARSLMEQCVSSGTAFFMKQGSQANWPAYKDISSWLPSLQVREFPGVR